MIRTFRGAVTNIHGPCLTLSTSRHYGKSTALSATSWYVYFSLYSFADQGLRSSWHCQPFTTSFPRADIHNMLSPDLLHQIIKGTFKDHLVTWVGDYLEIVHGKAGAAVIMADIDRQ